MFTFNAILKEIKNIPVDKLDEVYRFVHSLDPKPVKSAKQKDKTMSYAGIFSDMQEKDYEDYLKETIRIRNNLFNRAGKKI